MAFGYDNHYFAMMAPAQKHISNVLLQEADVWAYHAGVKITPRKEYHIVPNAYAGKFRPDGKPYAGYNKLLTFVATDKGAAGRVKGFRLASLLIDEATEIPKPVFDVAITRLSQPQAQLWAITNPDDPSHWFKTELIDPYVGIDDDGEFRTNVNGYRHWQYNLLPECDNPLFRISHEDGRLNARGQEYIESLGFLSGAKEQQLKYSKWAAAGGLVHPFFWRSTLPDDDLPEFPRYVIVVDHAEASITAANLYGIHEGRLIQVDEYHHDAFSQGVLTFAAQAGEIKQAFASYGPIVAVVSDWGNAMLTALRDAFQMSITKAYKQDKYNRGIMLTNKLLEAGRLRTTSNCVHTHREAAIYKYKEGGKEQVIKEDDHHMDATHYAAVWYSMSEAYGRL